MLRNSNTTWGSMSRILHWLMAALIAGQFILGKYAHGLDRSPEKINLMMWHKSIGITLLLLVLLRIMWSLLSPRPVAENATTGWEKVAARLSHVSLYLLMIMIPLSGWLMNSAKNVPFSLYRIFPWPDLIGPDKALGELLEEWHEGLGTALLVVLVVHVAAALFHYFVKKDSVLQNMLGSRAQEPGSE